MFQFVFAVIVSCLALVSSQSPVTICQPPVYQVNYTNLLSGDTGYIVVDFTKNLLAEISTKTENRLVQDFKNLKSYEISKNSTSCRQSILSPCRVQHQCLPPYAKLVPSMSGVVGNPRTYYFITTQTWEIPTEFDVRYRITYTATAGLPNWPIQTQELGFQGTISIYHFTNPNTAITDTKALVIPSNCVPNETLTALTVG